MKMCNKKTAFIVFLLVICHGRTVFSWHDETHLAVAKTAGYYKWYNSTGADITKVKAGSIESYNHFFNNPLNVKITPSFILKQAKLYNNPGHEDGHLYGAIVASLREFKNAYESGKYAEYHLAFCAHYITDLSQPLHNIPYDDFNRKHHVTNDGIVNKDVMSSICRIKQHMYEINLRPENFEYDLAKEIARLANLSRKLGHTLKKEDRDMTEKEAYIQLGHSTSLLKAVLQIIKE